MKITANTVFFFDLDNSLIYTDRANNLSYIDAIKEILGEDFSEILKLEKRIDRKIIKQKIVGISEKDYNKIIDYKQLTYKNYLDVTSLNYSIYNTLQMYYVTHKTALISNGKLNRIKQILQFHNLTDMFDNIFSSCELSIENKYEYAIKELSINPKNIILFEDDEQEIYKANKCGILIKNIFKI